MSIEGFLIHPLVKTGLRAILIGMVIGLGAGTNGLAALPDGMISGVEESLSERVGKKGERLIIVNFYTPEMSKEWGVRHG